MLKSAVAAITLGVLFIAAPPGRAALAAQSQKPDACEAVYKRYPVALKCPHWDAACLQQNADNRKARIAAGCAASRHSKS